MKFTESIMKPAVVLLSGGIDSTTTLAIAKNEGFDCYAITFDYGQRHLYELRASKLISQAIGTHSHIFVPFNLREIGGSALTDDIPVPKGRDENAMGEDIPVTYVPARNTIFLSFALSWAEVIGAFDIFIGANAVDYSGYPDCRPEYISAFEQMANLATKAGVEGKGKFKIHAPLIEISKAEIIRIGSELGLDYSLTHSCYDPDQNGSACGKCDSCTIRKRGFEEAKMNDPTRYASGVDE